MNAEWKEIIETTWKNRNLLKDKETQTCIKNIIEEIDKGRFYFVKTKIQETKNIPENLMNAR